MVVVVVSNHHVEVTTVILILKTIKQLLKVSLRILQTNFMLRPLLEPGQLLVSVWFVLKHLNL